MASSLDYLATPQRVAQLCVPVIADWCSISLYEGDELERVALASAQQPPSDPEDGEHAIAVPMAMPERVVGVLSLATKESGRRLSDADMELARELARRAGTAIENARLYMQVQRVATTLQSSLLPPELPVVPGWRFRALYLPAGGEADVGRRRAGALHGRRH